MMVMPSLSLRNYLKGDWWGRIGQDGLETPWSQPQMIPPRRLCSEWGPLGRWGPLAWPLGIGPKLQLSLLIQECCR